MLWEKLEQVNRLRKQAMADPEFLHSAEEHAQAIENEEHVFTHRRKSNRHSGPKSLADIYSQSQFGTNPGEAAH